MLSTEQMHFNLDSLINLKSKLKGCYDKLFQAHHKFVESSSWWHLELWKRKGTVEIPGWVLLQLVLL